MTHFTDLRLIHYSFNLKINFLKKVYKYIITTINVLATKGPPSSTVTKYGPGMIAELNDLSHKTVISNRLCPPYALHYEGVDS